MSDWVVHIVDDDEAIRDSLRFMLESNGFRIETYKSAEVFLSHLTSLAPGWIVTDVRMGGMSGLDLLKTIKERRLSTMPAIVMTGHGDIPLAVEAMRSGAVDFLEKPFSEQRLLESLSTARASVSERASKSAESLEAARRYAVLSGRERDVLEGLLAGHPNKTIAFNLGISARTVEIYRANLMTKMKAGSLSELVRLALLVRTDG